MSLALTIIVNAVLCVGAVAGIYALVGWAIRTARRDDGVQAGAVTPAQHPPVLTDEDRLAA
jgi:hypothetical protein